MLHTLEMGDFHMVDHRAQTLYSGAYAIEVVCRDILTYGASPLALTFHLYGSVSSDRNLNATMRSARLINERNDDRPVYDEVYEWG